MRIATGEETEELETDRVKSAAAELGSRGGRERASKLTPERRTEIKRNIEMTPLCKIEVTHPLRARGRLRRVASRRRSVDGDNGPIAARQAHHLQKLDDPRFACARRHPIEQN